VKNKYLYGKKNIIEKKKTKLKLSDHHKNFNIKEENIP
jgi:hypothetical protein